ncbi:MAG: radical SAM protein [Thermoanaerobaculia bacterium]|nr:radical SAM protein [Thermoanaerobaculia bacterium]
MASSADRFWNLSPTATVLSPAPERVAAFDREGRLLTFLCGESFFKRSLGSRLYLRDRSDGRRWREIPPGEASALFAGAHDLALAMAAEAGDPALAARVAAEIAPWTPERLAGESGRFAAAYRPIAILPPDRYLSVVVQATEGCTWNRCTFCSFYQGRPFRVREGAELARHVARVKGLLGRDLARRRSVFLADGNALALGQRRLRPLFELLARELPGRPVASFVDVWSGERHDPADWDELARAGLEQVYVGMETGLDELLALVRKPGSAAECESFVAALKRAGIAVTPIVMVGLGGEGHRAAHRAATLASLARMPLDRRDLVYLSPFVEEPGSAYAAERERLGLGPMGETEIAAEVTAIAAALRARGLRVGRYDIREFFY